MSRLSFLTTYAQDGTHYNQEEELLKFVNDPNTRNRLSRVFANKAYNITKPVMDAVVDKMIDPKQMTPYGASNVALEHRFYDYLKPEHINKMLDVQEPAIIPKQAAHHANTSAELTKALSHPNREVRRIAVWNPEATIKHLEDAHDHPSNDERMKKMISVALYNKRKESEGI